MLLIGKFVDSMNSPKYRGLKLGILSSIFLGCSVTAYRTWAEIDEFHDAVWSQTSDYKEECYKAGGLDKMVGLAKLIVMSDDVREKDLEYGKKYSTSLSVDLGENSLRVKDFEFVDVGDNFKERGVIDGGDRVGFLLEFMGGYRRVGKFEQGFFKYPAGEVECVVYDSKNKMYVEAENLPLMNFAVDGVLSQVSR